MLFGSAAAQTVTPEIEAKPAYLFPVAPVTIGNHAEIAYWVDGSTQRLRLEIRDRTRVLTTLPARHVRGLYRVSWDLRMVPPGVNEREAREEGGRLPLPLVLPGKYTLALIGDTREQSQPIEVFEDPRVRLSPAERAAWTGAQLRLWRVVMDAEEQRTKALALREQARMLKGTRMPIHAARLGALATELEETGERAEKLLTRIARKPVPVPHSESRRIDAWQASAARLQAEVAAIQQNMRSNPR